MELSYHFGNLQGFNSPIKSNSIVQLKARVDTQNEDHCLLLAKTYILNNPIQNKKAVNKAKTKQKVIDDTSNSNFSPQPKYNCVSIG